MGFGFGGDIRLPQRRDWLLDRVVETGSILMKRVGGGRAGEMAGHWFISHEDVTPHSILGDVYARTAAARPAGVDLLARAAQNRSFAVGRILFEAARAFEPRVCALVDHVPRAPGQKPHRLNLHQSANRVGISRPAGDKDEPACLSLNLVVAEEKGGGLGLEETKAETAHRLFNDAAIAPAAAVRIIQLTNARDGSARPASDVIGRSLKRVAEKQMNPQPQTTPAHIAWICARIGGWNCCGKPPGPKTMAHGWKSLMLMLQAVRHRIGRSTCVNPAATREWSSLSALP